MKIKSVGIGVDHAGFSMKSLISEFLKDNGVEVVDCGPADEAPCDYQCDACDHREPKAVGEISSPEIRVFSIVRLMISSITRQ